MLGVALAFAIEHLIIESHVNTNGISGLFVATFLLSTGALFGAQGELAIRGWRSRRNAERSLRYICWVADNKIERDDPNLAENFRAEVARIRGLREANALTINGLFVEVKALFMKLPRDCQDVAVFKAWVELDQKTNGTRATLERGGAASA